MKSSPRSGQSQLKAFTLSDANVSRCLHGWARFNDLMRNTPTMTVWEALLCKTRDFLATIRGSHFYRELLDSPYHSPGDHHRPGVVRQRMDLFVASRPFPSKDLNDT